MKEKHITLKEIWQNKLERYAVLSLVMLMILVVIAPFFPHLWLLWIAVFVLITMVYVALMWIITKQEEIKTNGR